MDGTKVQRAKHSLMGDVTEREEQRLKNKPPSCIMMDSRIDKNTLVMHHDEVTQKFYPRVEAEDHYTITDGDGKYLHHFTKELKQNTDETYNEDADSDEKLDKVTDTIKPAEVVAQLLYKWTVTKGIDKTLDLLGADSTASNTGCNAGIIAWLEKLLCKKLHWPLYATYK